MAGSLLATSALTVAAEGAIITEPPDFGNFSSPTVLPAGATGFSGIGGVTGSPGNWVADVDMVEFSGLTPGPLSYVATFPGSDGFFFMTSGNAFISSQMTAGTGQVNIPSNGVLRVSVGGEGMSRAYTLEFSSPVPEPSTLTGLALGLGALAATRRKKA